METERGGKCEGRVEGGEGAVRQHRERENEGDSQPDREVVSLYQERAALAGSSLSVVVPLIQSAAASASEAPGWAKTPRVPSPRPTARPGGAPVSCLAPPIPPPLPRLSSVFSRSFRPSALSAFTPNGASNPDSGIRTL